MKEKPFVWYLDSGSGKDCYWMYRHMVIQEDCINCLSYLNPEYAYKSELDHSSGHNSEYPDGLSTTGSVFNLGWRGKSKTRDLILIINDIGTFVHKE